MPENLRKILKKVAEFIANEIEKNPQFLKEINILLIPLQQTSIKDKIPKRKVVKSQKQIPDLYLLYRKSKKKFYDTLNQSNIEQLQSIISDNRLDISQKSNKWRNKERLIQFIANKIAEKENSKDVFRNYSTK